MRIITGKFKKAHLFSVPGNISRPTTDFLKEIMFSVLPGCKQNKVLDLFAGTGSLGLESISRGASSAVFVDVSSRAVKTIHKNIEKFKCDEICKVYHRRVSPFLKTYPQQFDLIFLDPPYNKNLVNRTIELIFLNKVPAQNGKIIVEHSKKEAISEKWKSNIEYEKISGESVITIINDFKMQDYLGGVNVST